MIPSPDFLRSILDSVTEQIVVIDDVGRIQFVNKTWIQFGEDNACKVVPDEWSAMNYLSVCDAAAKGEESYGRRAARGIRGVIAHDVSQFNLEYPCHSPGEKRWFMMGVTPLDLAGIPYFAISHRNITQRKLAEERVTKLSRIDSLTDIPNRGYFDQLLAAEWQRCSRLGLPITLAILDIDHFKLLNDHYGHPSGDDCLIKIGGVFNSVKKRPGDFFARYGGEEFALVFGNSSTDEALVPLKRIVNKINDLKLPNKMSPTDPYVTVSIGLATMLPEIKTNERDLIKAADLRVYEAKRNGRNQIVSS